MLKTTSILRPLANVFSFINYKRDRMRLTKRIEDGLKIGKNVYIMEGVEIDVNYPYLIEIHDWCRISKGVRILAHDATLFRDLGITRLAPVRILENSFIGERALILPGVTIGPRAIVAAGSVVNRDIGEGKIAAGNPARVYSSHNELVKRYLEILEKDVLIRKQDLENGKVIVPEIIERLQKHQAVFIYGLPKRDPFYVNLDKKLLQNITDRALDSAGVRVKKYSSE